MLAGITLVANGTLLGYPYEVCIQTLLDSCDKVFVATDVNNKDDTLERLYSFGEKVQVIESAWDWGVTGGEALAWAANTCLAPAKAQGFDNVLYVQADEIVNPSEIENLRLLLGKYNFEIERLYFWETLDYVNLSWTAPLTRIAVLDENFSIVGDGMDTKSSDRFPSLRVSPEICRIYHYSRVGTSEDVAKRLNQLDSLYHDSSEYTPIEQYVFGENNNFERGAFGARIVLASSLKGYKGHPKWVVDFYRSVRR